MDWLSLLIKTVDFMDWLSLLLNMVGFMDWLSLFLYTVEHHTALTQSTTEYKGRDFSLTDIFIFIF